MSIKSMDVNELKQKLDNADNLLLIDVREQDEWNAGHIKEAKFMPLSTFEKDYTALTDKDQMIVLQCRSGKRSLRAGEFLAEHGFKDLTNLEGGILDWQAEGHPIVTE